MVGAGGHPADCVVACTFSSMADHTLCCGNALGDVLRSVHKKKNIFKYSTFTVKFTFPTNQCLKNG